MSQSRFYARPRSYTTGSGDPRGVSGASVASRTAFRYTASFGQRTTLGDDPARYDGIAEICDCAMIPQAGIANGVLVSVADGFGQLDVYEFRKDGGPVTAGHILVDISGDTTAAQVATTFLAAVNGVSALSHVTGSIPVAGTVRFTQDTGYFGGRTGFDPSVLAGSGGVISSQTLPANFIVTRVQRGLDPLSVLPGWVGPRPVLISTNSRPLFLVT